MKANKFLCFILLIALMLGLFSGCASAQKDAISNAEVGGPTQIAETISLDGLDIDSVEYAIAWFRNMVGELSEPESSEEDKFHWNVFSNDLCVSIWPDDNVPERMYRIMIFNNQASLSEENAQQFKNLCLAAIAQFANDDVASQMRAFLEVGPVTEGAHPYEGNDNIHIYYYPETNRCILSYYSDINEVAFETAIKMDTGFIQYVHFVPGALTPRAPATDALEPLPTEIPIVDKDEFYTGDRVCTYDEQGNLIKVEYDNFVNRIYEYKTVQEYKYDDNGNLTWYALIFYNPEGSIYNNETEEIFCQMYGSENRVIKKHETYDTSEYTVEYTYNAQGVLTDTYVIGTDLGFSYEGTTKYEYNDRGLLIKEHTLGVDTNSTEEYTTEYEYNSQDLLIKAHSTRAQSDGDFIESTTEYEYNDHGSPISVYTLISECTPYYVVEEEEQYNYTYDETGKCIMVEFMHSFNGQEYPGVQFQCDNSGYIYDNGGEQLYPLSLPSVYYPELPRIIYSYG